MTKRVYQCACAECGVPFTTTNGRQGTSPRAFCCAQHRISFYNRRNIRGAQMYDILMSKRYDRATESEARGLLDRLARAARDADKALRDGRPSWLPFEQAKQNIPLGYGDHGDGR